MTDEKKPDYKSTVFLPRTDFPMKANLPGREPELLARWAAMDLRARTLKGAAGREKFILHDGPPYANGHLHMGHALNKVLKDLINRSQQMLGKNAVYVPGWDCHGLPIEWKVEERYRAAGKNKDDVPVIEFRRECREFAEKWISVQSDEFQRLGVTGDWENPYTTMAFAAEAQIVRELGKFIMNGGLYRGEKPVMWSVVEKTALAEAEVEYHDHTSTTIHVGFPVAETPLAALAGAEVLIWTTTPWTMPGNRAIAYGEEIDYELVEVTSVEDGATAKPHARLLIARALVDDVLAACHVTGWRRLGGYRGADLEGVICRHPLHEKGYGDFTVPLLPGEHVTTEQGTGFVHTAPGHGEEDFVVGQRFGLEVPRTVGPDGLFYAHVPIVGGVHVFKADAPIVEALRASGHLLAQGKLRHSYPHSWRSKAPLIYRTTPQWFISMSANNLRERALAAIDATAFFPEGGRNRLRSMVATRPDWCVSRQRAWGVPITVFANKETGAPLRDQKVLDRIAEAVEAEGADAWFASPAERFLAPEYDPADFEQVFDILDVWFDSGVTHSFVLEARDELAWPATLYLEGSDQHRGWFQSSLLESCGTRGRAPYEQVLTHGFLLDEQGYKMSKSRGNDTPPQDVVAQHGADVLRLWVALSDYTEDLRVGPDIVKQHADYYRRLRNTLRYLLGNLDGYDAGGAVQIVDMPELERWVLHRLWELDALMRRSFAVYDFHGFYHELHNFCTVDLSAFYFDIRKDALYCDAPSSLRRRSAQTVLDILFRFLVRWLAPVLCFTAEEAWLTRYGDGEDVSVHLEIFEAPGTGWRDDALAAKWARVRDLRRVVTGALERERAEKRLRSSLEAAPLVTVESAYLEALEGVDLAEVSIASDIDVRPPDRAQPDDGFTLPDVSGVTVWPRRAAGEKCGRCWRILPEVSESGALCGRCREAVAEISAPDGSAKDRRA